MDYWSPGVLQAHTGSGGMTSSLSVGKAGSAAVRKLKQFPLSPILVTGRSGIKAAVPLEDPRFHSVTTPAGELARAGRRSRRAELLRLARPLHPTSDASAEISCVAAAARVDLGADLHTDSTGSCTQQSRPPRLQRQRIRLHISEKGG